MWREENLLIHFQHLNYKFRAQALSRPLCWLMLFLVYWHDLFNKWNLQIQNQLSDLSIETQLKYEL